MNGCKGLGRWLPWVAALALGGGCGADPPPARDASEEPKKRDAFALDERADPGKAKRIVDKALAALKDDEDLDKARDFLQQAEPFCDDTMREEVRKVRQEIDRVEAQRYVPPIAEALRGGRCLEGVDKAVEVVDRRRTSHVPHYLREAVRADLNACLERQLEIDLSAGRELVADPRVKRVLDEASYAHLAKQADASTIGTLLRELDEPIKARRWPEVLERLEEMVHKGEVGRDEQDKVMGVVRAGIAAEIDEKVSAALDTSMGLSTVGQEVDALVVLARWSEAGKPTPPGPLAAAPLPARVTQRRRDLAFGAECQALRCRMVDPQPMWVYGRVTLSPVLEPRKPGTETVEHAQPVWKLAESTSFALVATRDPGRPEGIGARIEAAAGWLRPGDVRTQDTSQLLPPGEAIVGTRIWGPLREGQKTLELGTVQATRGSQLVVKRMADLGETTVQRSAVFFGLLAPGTKVLARCDNMLTPEPALIENVLPGTRGGDPVAQLRCLGAGGEPEGPMRTELIGSLRTRPEWLPRP